MAQSTADLRPLSGWTSHSWTISDGLPDQSIEAIAQTPDGYLWLGTPHGLARFNGSKFENAGGSLRGLQEFGVSCLLVSKTGDLWVGSVGGGITRITHGQIQRLYEEGSVGLTVRALYQDEKSTIWAATGHGLYRFDGKRFSQDTLLGDWTLTSIAPDGAGGLWIAGSRLFHRSLGRVDELALPYQDKDAVIHGLVLTRDGSLWVGTPYGLFQSRRGHPLQLADQVSGGVRGLFLGTNGLLWIGTVERGLIARKVDGEFDRVLGPDETMSKAVRTFAQSSNGEVWVGTTAGLIRVSESGMNLYRISTAAGSDFGSVSLDSDGTVWLSAGRLTRLHAGRRSEEVHIAPASIWPIRAYLRDSSRAVWIGTIGGGCYRYAGGRVSHFPYPRAIRGFLEGSGGVIWVATDGGMARWQHGQLTYLGRQVGGPGSAVRAMALTPDASLWVGTSEGLYRLVGDQFVGTGMPSNLLHQRIWALHTGKDGSLWIGTESGLYVWRNGALLYVDLPSQISDTSAVLSVVEDSKERLLVAQPTRIFRFNREDMQEVARTKGAPPASAQAELRVVGVSETFAIARETGAELYGTIPSTAVADTEGGAWFATYIGLIHIGAVSTLRPEPPPPVIIERVVVDGVAVPVRPVVELSSPARNVQIQATPIVLSSRPGLELRGRLVGFESEWNKLVPDAASIYNRLTPGQYTYRVEANWAGASPHSGAEITVVQLGPFYRRPWFVVALVALVALIVFIVYRLKVHQLELRFRAVSAERGRVAREIHDTVLQGCIAVYSLLEAYLSGQEVDACNGDEHSYAALLHHARDQVVETISEARSAIWNIRQNEGVESLNDVLRDLAKRLPSRSEVAIIFEESGAPIRLMPQAQHEIMMASREAILNALAHAHPARIILRLVNSSDNELDLVVSDDGRGFQPELQPEDEPRHFGLAGLQERLTALGGSCTIQSSVGLGTSVQMRLSSRALALLKRKT